MGNVRSFRRPPRRPPPRRRGIGASAAALRPFVLFAVLVVLWLWFDAGIVEPPSWLLSEPELINASFTRCGPGRGAACAIDGDTIKLGERKIRIVGIDTPEIDARCPQEAQLAETATVRLLALLNQGQFEMVGRIDDPTDKYGRDLRTLRRRQSDGTYVSIGRQMIDSGAARWYLGGMRGGWC